MLVSHYWDGITSTHQMYCSAALKKRFPAAPVHHIRARVGFPTDTVDTDAVEDTLRGRSFLFFALAAMAANTVPAFLGSVDAILMGRASYDAVRRCGDWPWRP